MIEARPRARPAHGIAAPEHDRVRELEAEKAQLFAAQAVAMVGSWDADFNTLGLIWSEEMHRIFETTPQEFQPTSRGFLDRIHPEDRASVEAAFGRARGEPGAQSIEHRLLMSDGRVKFVEERWQSFFDDEGRPLRAIGTCQDITARTAAAEVLKRSQTLLRMAGRLSRMGAWSVDLPELKQTWSDEVCLIHERPPGCTPTVAEATAFHAPEFRDTIDRAFGACVRDGTPFDVESEIVTASGRHVWVRSIGEAERDTGGAIRRVQGAIQDISERKQLESQLLQAQKMDAVGRLAGGVAHDFNNALGVILGYTEILMCEADGVQNSRLEQILKATQRAAGLTRQLLAFSRQQIVDPRVLDLNALLSELQKMLGRLIGEDMDLAILPGLNLGRVKADPGQLEQVVMNLCVNARDAMPGGGLLRIETANVELDAGRSAGHEQIEPGRYVMLAVSDTGCGIEKGIRSKIFEPFFTTKGPGKGTGLGLAMVYGIVKQAGGFVWLYSEVGQGTTFKIYLPRVDAPVTGPTPDGPIPTRGSETLLLVEDEAPLRAIAREILEEHGYRVIEASSAIAALDLAQGFPEPIHLLLTDVVMPGMNGRVLAESLVAARPELRVLYMSGYTDDIIAHSGVLESGTLLLEKPFTSLALLGRVRTALAARTTGVDA